MAVSTTSVSTTTPNTNTNSKRIPFLFLVLGLVVSLGSQFQSSFWTTWPSTTTTQITRTTSTLATRGILEALPASAPLYNDTKATPSLLALTPFDYERRPDDAHYPVWCQPQTSDAHLPWRSCLSADPVTVDIVLTVWRRNNLVRQLHAVADQTLPVQRVWIIQNEEYHDVAAFVAQFEREYQESSHDDQAAPPFAVEIIRTSVNSKFHGRFHIAYVMSHATYVSVWDDDVAPRSGWMRYCVEFSAERGGALVGANGRRIIGWHNDHPGAVQQWEATGFGIVDFVGHVWTLRRDHLRFFLGNTQLTYTTGEDVQLSAALQLHGIATYSPPHDVDSQVGVIDLPAATDQFASSRSPQDKRHWLICALMYYHDFRPRRCNTCTRERAKQCLEYFEQGGIVKYFVPQKANKFP